MYDYGHIIFLNAFVFIASDRQVENCFHGNNLLELFTVEPPVTDTYIQKTYIFVPHGEQIRKW